MAEKTAALNRTVTLMAPGIKQFDASEIRKMISQPQSLRALEMLHSRANLQPGENSTYDQTLLQLFGFSNDSSLDTPVGAISYLLLKGEDPLNSWKLRADPVVIQPNRDHLLLMGNAGLEISLQEAQQIVQDINATYADTLWTLVALTPKQWIISQKEPQQLKTHSLSEVSGRNINDYLPSGEDGKSWHSLMNELQMFLHAHPVNQHRQMQGLPSINSLWFWGAGTLPEVTTNEKPFIQCWSDETISLGLARLSNIPRVDLPADGKQWLNHAITEGSHFLMIEQLNSDAAKNDPVEWWRNLVVFNNQWLSPLIEALRQKSIIELNVIDSSGDRYQLTRSSLSKWWKLISRI